MKPVPSAAKYGRVTIPELLTLGQEPEIALGVRGYTIEHNDALYVPLVIATRPGEGDVARFLDGLPVDRTVKFPNVINRQLAGMLHRRGFRLTHEFDETLGESVAVWVRP